MKEYDIAISFAGEDRGHARQLAERLYHVYGLKIFYDDYEQSKLVGEDLVEYLTNVFQDAASYCILIISKYFVEKPWAVTERRAALARKHEQFGQAYIIPVRLDDTPVPGLPNTIGYIALPKVGSDRAAQLIYQKVCGEAEINRLLRLAQKDFNAGRMKKAIELLSDKRLADNIDALMLRGDALHKSGDNSGAVDDLLKVIEKDKENFLAYFLLGMAYFRMMDFDNSAEYLEKARERSPQHITVLRDLAAAKRYAQRLRHPIFGWFYRWRIGRLVEQLRIEHEIEG